MKIAVFIKSSASSGGLETQNQLLINGLRERGHEVVEFRTVSPFGDPGDAQKIGNSSTAVISQSAAGTRFLRERKEKTPPVVVIQHGTLWGSLLTRWLSTSPLRRFSLLLKLIPYAIKAYILDQIRLRRCNMIIAVSKQIRKALIREYFLKPEKITVVYNGIEIKKFKTQNSKLKVRDGLGIKRNERVVLYLGRLAAEKGLDILLESFKKAVQLPNCQTAKLIVVGDGPQHDMLVQHAKKLGIEDRVKFAGRVAYEETPKYYQVADIFVLPSMAREGLPMAVIEAMASGLPVVASKVGGIPEAVTDDETGILVELGDVEELSSALSKLLTDEKLRERLGRGGREIAEERFSQEAMVEKTLSVIRDVVSLD